MKFKIDENLSNDVAELLNKHNHDAKTVFEQQMVGEVDSQIANVCQHEDRCLITLDKDFADIRTYPPENYPGLIVLRPKRQDKVQVLKLITFLLKVLPTEPLEKHLWIVEEKRIRIRGNS